MNERRPLIGMRTIKTVLGISLAMYLGKVFSRPNLTTIMASVFITLASSVGETLTISKNRIVAVLLGGILGVILYMFVEGPLSVAILTGLGTLISILLTNYLKWYNTLFLALVVVTAIVSTPFDNNEMMFLYFIDLMVDTIFGILIGVFINVNISKPDREKMLLVALINNQDNINKSFKLYLLGDYSTENLSNILFFVNSTEDLYVKYKDDYNINNKDNKYYFYDIKDIFTTQLVSLGLVINLIASKKEYMVSYETQQIINNFYKEDIIKDSRVILNDAPTTVINAYDSSIEYDNKSRLDIEKSLREIIKHIDTNEELLEKLRKLNKK